MPFRLTPKQFERLNLGKPIGVAAKYRSKLSARDGLTFHSVFEANHYDALKLRQAAGEIRDLRCQTPWVFSVNGVTVSKYIADFEYEELVDGAWVHRVVDTKSEYTRRLETYRIKRKLMLACYGITVVEVVSTPWAKRKRP